MDSLWQQAYALIRGESPSTIISPYRGDVCAAIDGHSIYTFDGPKPNSTDDIAKCGAAARNGCTLGCS
jgi:hypothetical protein